MREPSEITKGVRLAGPLAEPGTSPGDERFRVVRELGRGGMGVVFMVEDRLRDQYLALKRVRHTAGVDIRRLKREYRAIEAITHRNIVSVYELGIDADGPYFLMEAVDGPNLHAYCRASDLRSRAEPCASTDMHARAPDSRIATRERACAATSLRWPSDVSNESDRATLPIEAGSETCTQGTHEKAGSPALGAEGLARLYVALPQLVAALECLHQNGLVHRDLKPANVLVRCDGVLKLLDFGILGETGSAPAPLLQGTLSYVAPEQIRGEPPAPANDLYALGVTLFEVITGHLPLVATSGEGLLLQHLNDTPIQVRALAPECPPWLADLIGALLRKDAEHRPTLNQLRELAAAHVPGFDAPPAASMPRVRLLEREHEQHVLLDLLDESDRGDFRFVAICGESGLGKSALLEWTRSAVRRRRLTEFASHARFSERVPFNAIDGLVDDLASMLERFPELVADADGQRLRQHASGAFSVLRRASAEDHATQHGLDRKVVFDALIELIRRCTRITGTVVLFCDDLQWSDSDSVSLIERLLSTRPARVLLVASVRSDSHTASFARAWPQLVPDVRLDLERLSDPALARIIGDVAADAGRPLDQTVAHQVARSCHGRPLLAVLSGRVAAEVEVDASVQPIVWLLDRYAARGLRERKLLSVLVAIDGDTALQQLARLLDLSAGEIEQALSPLVHERLIRATGSFGEQRCYDFAHDLIRGHASRLLEPHELREAHAVIAAELEQSGSAAELVRHLLAAQSFERVSELAEIGAREAESANAYGLAVELYGIAIEHARETKEHLRLSRAVALERSGRYLDAASEWQTLAASRTGQTRVEALLQQAKALLATDHIREGRAILEQVREERNERSVLPEHWLNLVAALRFMRGPQAVPGGTRIRAHGVSTPSDEREVFLGTMIGYFEPIAGVRHMLRARGNYRRIGNRVQAAEVDYVLAYIALWTARRVGRTALSERYVQSAREVLGGTVGPEHGRPYALDTMVRGVQALHEGRLREAATLLTDAIAFYEACGRKGSFEYLFCRIYREYAARHQQSLTDWERVLGETDRAVQDGQDSSLRCHVAFAQTRFALLSGQVEDALRISREALATWPQDEPSLQRFFTRLNILTPMVYVGDAVRARSELHEAVKAHARFMPQHNMLGGDLFSHLAMFEVAALQRRVRGASRRRVDGWAKQAEACCPMGRHMAMRAAAYAADYAGEPELALRLLERAERRAHQVEQSIDIAVAQYQRGIRLLGSEGEALVRSAERLMTRVNAHPLLLQEDPARR